MTGALEDLRVVDFTQGIAGPMACMLLADLGAEVIKVEPPAGDRMQDHPGYLTWNRNKLRLTLDVTSATGLQAARGLLASADVAVFDAAPGELERRGLDGATLVDRHPALLHVWMPPYGERGRWSGLPADDGLLSAVSGVAFMQSGTEEQPVHIVLPQVTYGQALIAAAAIAASLYERERGGRGQALIVSGLDGVAALKTGGAIQARNARAAAARGERGAGVSYGPNYRIYRCADGERLFLGCLTERFFVRALELLGLPEVFTAEGVDRDFKKLQQSPMKEAAIARLEARFAEKPRADWLRILHDPLVPLTPVDTREAWFHGETVAANEMRVELEHPVLGAVEMPGVPVKFSATPGSVRHLPRPVTLDELPPHVPTVAGRQPEAGGPAADSPPDPATPTDERDARSGGNHRGPLAGVRVLDVATFIAGSLAPAILANFGAEVVKIEPPEGDPWRAQDLGFIPWNRGKRGLVLDLKHPDGRAAFYDLAGRADVVVDNYRVGVLERLGIDYKRLAAANPRIIACSGTAYGPTGPLASEPGFDTVLQARSGIAAAQGGADDPVTLRMSPVDSATAIMSAFGAAVALYVRERTGRGQRAWTSLANLSVLCQSGELVGYAGRPPNPVGGADCLGVSALRRFYRCADGWIALACTTGEQFTRLCRGLGHPEWTDGRPGEGALSEPRDGRLAALIADAVAGLPIDAVLDRLRTRDVPAAAAVTHGDMFSDPVLNENGFFDRYEHPEYGAVLGVRRYASWSRTPGGFTRRAPLLGEHTVAVLQDFGFEAERIAGLLADGAAVQRTDQPAPVPAPV